MTSPIPSTPDQWFAIHTEPRKESVVFQGLLAMQIGDAFVPVLKSEARARHSPTASGRSRLLFSNYVFFRDEIRARQALAEIDKMPGVRNILGSWPTSPSPIPGCEINVLKNLCGGHFPPEWIPAPNRGMKVRIRRGPMTGATGTVLRRSGQCTVLAFSMPILAGAYELVVPTSNLVILEDKQGSREPGKKQRHRAGRRMKRCRKQSGDPDNPSGQSQ
jgi:transcription antitermination factor NusG